MNANNVECFKYVKVMRDPEAVRELWDWARKNSPDGMEHKTPHAAGVLATLQYLMREDDFPPQNYKGEFTLKNVLSQSEQGRTSSACAGRQVYSHTSAVHSPSAMRRAAGRPSFL